MSLSSSSFSRAALIPWLCLSLVGGWASSAWAAKFVKNESLVTAQPDLVDAEYSANRGQLVWADSVGRIWTAGIDYTTGLFVPANGKGTLVTQNAASSEDLPIIGNGPEWLVTAKGDQIVFTRFVAGSSHSQDTARLALAESSDGLSWTSRTLSSNLARSAPYASSDKKDKSPRISYVDPNGRHYWRNPYDPSTETLVTAYPRSFRSLRFVRGARAVVFVAPVNEIDQVHYQDLDTGVVEQLTFDAGQKDQRTVPWMWPAPEFNNEMLLATVADIGELRIYRKMVPDGQTTASWQVIRRLTLPNSAPLNSPEPFTYKNKSYVFFAAGTATPNYPTSIWLAGVDASQNLLRQLTDDSLLRMRSDPEVYVTAAGPYLYFNRFDPALGGPADPPNCSACSEGIYRTYTGLSAPK